MAEIPVTSSGQTTFVSTSQGDETFKAAHTHSDVDVDRQAQHHTLGKKPTQAAAGNHDHTYLVGELKLWLLPTAPVGYLLCEGQTINRTAEYEDLFTSMGWSGSTKVLPDPRNRHLIGTDGTYPVGTTDGLSLSLREDKMHHDHQHDIDTTKLILASTATIDNAGSHDHAITSGGFHSHSLGSPGTTEVASGTGATVASGTHGHGGTSSDGTHAHSGHTDPVSDHNHPATVLTTVNDALTSKEFIVRDLPVGEDWEHPFIMFNIIIRYDKLVP